MLQESTVFAMIAVNDMPAARDFYEHTLGLRQIDENAGGITYQSGNGKVFVYQAPTGGKNPATSAAWEVNDIEKIVRELQAKGVTFEHYDGFPVEWQGEIAVMGTVKAAWFKDPSGNTLQLGNTSG